MNMPTPTATLSDVFLTVRDARRAAFRYLRRGERLPDSCERIGLHGILFVLSSGRELIVSRPPGGLGDWDDLLVREIVRSRPTREERPGNLHHAYTHDADGVLHRLG